jgi:hypothetical protein
VGERTPSEAITNEYAKADQVYVEKTIVSHAPFPANYGTLWHRCLQGVFGLYS